MELRGPNRTRPLAWQLVRSSRCVRRTYELQVSKWDFNLLNEHIFEALTEFLKAAVAAAVEPIKV